MAKLLPREGLSSRSVEDRQEGLGGDSKLLM